MRLILTITSLTFFISLGSAQCSDSLRLLEKNPSADNIVYADLDQDNDMDILLPAELRGEIYFYENDGNGNFGPRDTILISDSDHFQTTHLSVADLNGDSHMDLIVFGRDGIRIFENDGANNFINYYDYFNNNLYDLCRDCIACEDLDGDGDKDIIFTLSGSTYWLRNNGSFNFTYYWSSVHWGGEFAVGDLNGDNLNDIVGGRYELLQVNYNTGTGPGPVSGNTQFGSYINNGEAEVELFDYDGDTDLDVIYLGKGSPKIKIYINNGLGQFNTSTTIYNGSGSLNGLTIANVNGDNYPDLVFLEANGGVRDVKCMNGQLGAFATPVTLYTENLKYYILTSAKIDASPYASLIVKKDTIDFLEEYHQLTFQAQNTFDLSDTLDTFDQLWGSGSSARLSDLNLDGELDVFSYPFIHLNNGQDEFNSYNLGYVSPHYDAILYDFNGDGYDDFIGEQTSNNLVYRENFGNGILGPFQTLESSFYARELDLFDYNNDGIMDVISSKASNSVKAIISDGVGNFNNPLNAFGFHWLSNTYDFEAFDVGVYSSLADDVVAAAVIPTAGDDDVYVALVNGITPIIIGDVDDALDIFVTDVDGDQYSDVIVDAMDRIEWYKNNGNGTFLSADTMISGLNWHITQFEDMDNDGVKDFIIAESAIDQIYWMKGNGDGTFQQSIPIVNDSYLSGGPYLKILDYNMDGRLDVIYNHHDGHDEMTVILNDSTAGSFTNPTYTNDWMCSSYLWSYNNQTYANPGTYVGNQPNSSGCDSVVIITLTSNIDSVVEVTSSCLSYLWPANNTTYSSSGIYYATLTNSFGCDSVIQLDLTINTGSTTVFAVQECDSYTWPLNGITYTSSGSFTEVVPNQFGCDSVVHLTLTLGASNMDTVSVTECGSQYSWGLNGQTYTQSGLYNTVVLNTQGCDSTVILDLTLQNFDPGITVVNDTTLESDFNGNGTYQWVDCDQNYATIAGANNQQFLATVDGNYAVIVDDGVCTDTSDCETIYYYYLGLGDLLSTSVELYPNPSNSTITVDFSNNNVAGHYWVYDNVGKVIMVGGIENESELILDIRSLSVGAYRIEIQTASDIVSRSFVKIEN